MVGRAPPVAAEAAATSNPTQAPVRGTAKKRKTIRAPEAPDSETSRFARKGGVPDLVKKSAAKRPTKKAPLPPPVDQGCPTKDPNEAQPIRQVVAKKIVFDDDQEPGTWWKSEMDYIRKTTRVAKSHRHLLGFSGIRENVEGCLEILMDLMPGNICQLKATGRYGLENIVETTCKSILEALDYLTRNDIVHRDVRPENILYEERGDGGFNLRLANFGLRIDMSSAVHNAGIDPYQAPEVLSCRAQMHAADMWSLFVSLCTLANLYQPSAYSDYRSARTSLYSIATLKPQPSQLDLRCLREAIIWHVKYRATAAQMLVKLYGGAGLASTGNVPELIAWDTWEGLFGGREVAQHLYDGHMDAFPADVHGRAPTQTARVGEVQISERSTAGIIPKTSTEAPTITPLTTVYAQAPCSPTPEAAQVPWATLDAAVEAKTRERIEQEMRGRIEAQTRKTLKPQLWSEMESEVAASAAAAREAIAARDVVQARVDEALAAREAAEQQCGEAMLAEKHEFMEAKRVRRTSAEVVRGEVEMRLQDAVKARDASRAQMAVQAREASEELVQARIAACMTEEKLNEAISRRDTVESQLREATMERDEIEESLSMALKERDTMAARVAKDSTELDQLRLRSKTAALPEPDVVYIREPQIIYIPSTASSAFEEPSVSPSVTYQMSPAMEENHSQFKSSVEPLADHEREQFLVCSDRSGFDSLGSLNNISQRNWQKHFVDFSTGISNENRRNIFS